MHYRAFTLLGALVLASAPLQAAPLSGALSGGGALEGGSGAPGSGVGLPGALQAAAPDSGIVVLPADGRYVAVAPGAATPRPHRALTRRQHAGLASSLATVAQ